MPRALTAAAPVIAVYVHWPYCARICPYCDFNVYKTRAIDTERWRVALTDEIKWWATQTPGRVLGSIYFGGGTPSLCPPELISDVIDACRRAWPGSDKIEVTLEANPTDAERSHFDAFRAAGVNRLSLGVQSFDDTQLRFLGRNHDGASARAALETALRVFDRVNFDFIYALPGETIADWRTRLSDGLAIGAGHLSAYQLTVEPGTAFENAVARGSWSPLDEELAAGLFDATIDLTARRGLEAYEVSNFARAGERSTHNLAYWRAWEYAGVGPGAHGRLNRAQDRYAIANHRAPASYLNAVETTAHGAVENVALTTEEAFTERLALGLRTLEGVSLSPGEAARLRTTAAPLLEDGLLQWIDDRRLVATQDGRRVLDGVVAALI